MVKRGDPLCGHETDDGQLCVVGQCDQEQKEEMLTLMATLLCVGVWIAEL